MNSLFSGIFRSWTNKIILINIIMFILTSILMLFLSESQLISLFALQPDLFLQGKNLWTLFTSMFMHANFSHLFFNMFSLFFVGNFVEKLIGKKRFLIFYIVSGLFAGLFFALLSGYFGYGFLGEKIFGNPSLAGVGASGAIFSLVGLLAILTPRNRVYLILGPFIALVFSAILGSIISNGALVTLLNWIITIYFVISIMSLLSFNPQLQRISVPVNMPFWILPIVAIVPVTIISLFIPLPIGNMAHLGGLIAGLIYGVYLKQKYPRKTRMISRHFSR